MSELPFVPKELVERLKRDYPLTEFKNIDNIEKLFYLQGQQHIIDKLWLWSSKQEKTKVLPK